MLHERKDYAGRFEEIWPDVRGFVFLLFTLMSTQETLGQIASTSMTYQLLISGSPRNLFPASLAHGYLLIVQYQEKSRLFSSTVSSCREKA